MTYDEKFSALEALVTDYPHQYTEAMLAYYLEAAGRKLLRLLYPFGAGVCDVPDEYAYKQVEIAAYLVNKRGAEGQTAHSENGISRTYEDADLPASMIREIVPHCGTFKGEAGTRSRKKRG